LTSPATVLIKLVSGSLITAISPEARRRPRGNHPRWLLGFSDPARSSDPAPASGHSRSVFPETRSGCWISAGLGRNVCIL